MSNDDQFFLFFNRDLDQHRPSDSSFVASSSYIMSTSRVKLVDMIKRKPIEAAVSLKN